MRSPLKPRACRYTINPFGLAFMTPVTVENASGEDIAVTLVGAVNPQGTRSRLPLFVSRFFALPSLRSRALGIRSGATRTVIYNWDDINFSEIVVRDARGEYRVMVVDPVPTEGQFHPPKVARFRIGATSSLTPASPEVIAAARSIDGANSRMWGTSLLSALPFGFFYHKRSERRTRGPLDGARVEIRR